MCVSQHSVHNTVLCVVYAVFLWRLHCVVTCSCTYCLGLWVCVVSVSPWYCITQEAHTAMSDVANHINRVVRVQVRMGRRGEREEGVGGEGEGEGGVYVLGLC